MKHIDEICSLEVLLEAARERLQLEVQCIIGCNEILSFGANSEQQALKVYVRDKLTEEECDQLEHEIRGKTGYVAEVVSMADAEGEEPEPQEPGPVKPDDAERRHIFALAMRYSNTAEVYERTLRRFIAGFAPAPHDEKFWGRVEEIVKNLTKYGAGREALVKRACDNMLWEVLNSGGWSMAAWEECAQFVQAYEELVSELRGACHDLEGLLLGEDSFGDLMDSLPLAGRDVCEALLAGKIANWQALSSAVLGHRPVLAPMILEGENYLLMSLEGKLQYFLPSVARREQERQETEQ